LPRIVFKNFRIVDFAGDFPGSLVVNNGLIEKVLKGTGKISNAQIVIDGRNFPDTSVLMPGFIDLHAHFRDPGFPDKETLESASLAAVAGGFTTVACMANTNPVIDTLEKALSLKARSDALALVDLHPVLSLTKNMEGTELSGVKEVTSTLRYNEYGKMFRLPLMVSEDGKDLADENLFLAAMGEARRLKVPVSCHCDFGCDQGGTEGKAVQRAIDLGKKVGCHIHIAHVSTKETLGIIRETKRNMPSGTGFSLSCETTPHHIAATEVDAKRMGADSFGRVNPSLATEADRKALVAAVLDGTIDAIATDHAPHTHADKAASAPGFVGLETAFAACLSNLGGVVELQRISALASWNPSTILGLHDRGRIVAGSRADLVLADTQAVWKVDTGRFKSRGRCTPFEGRELRGKILMTMNAGRIVFQERQK